MSGSSVAASGKNGAARAGVEEQQTHEVAALFTCAEGSLKQEAEAKLPTAE